LRQKEMNNKEELNKRGKTKDKTKKKRNMKT
jgi:hypothetical protein